MSPWGDSISFVGPSVADISYFQPAYRTGLIGHGTESNHAATNRASAYGHQTVAGSIQEPKRSNGISIAEACEAFLADAEAQHLSQASLKKYRQMLVKQYSPEDRLRYSPSLSQFSVEAGIQFASQISLTVLGRFRTAWKDGAISSAKKLERFRAVGRFFVDRGWWRENFVLKLKRPIVKNTPTMPFTQDEVSRLLAACQQYRDQRGRVGQDNASRLRAFILFLRYSGLRVSDAASCAVERVSGNRLFLYTQKTGVPVQVPLPSFVIAALATCPRVSAPYWFWTRVGSKDTLAGNWRRTFRRLCKIAGVKGGHPHRFRDTLAVELLQDGMTMESVSILLGHSSVKVTERHYAPWVKARQARLEADTARAWRNDPIAQAEILRGEGLQSAGNVQMIATPPRHENGEAAN